MAVATTDVGSFAFLFHADCTGQRLRHGIEDLKAALRQAIDDWDPFSADLANSADYAQAKGDRLRDLLYAAEKKEEGKALQAYRPYGLTFAYVGQLDEELEAAKEALATALRNLPAAGLQHVNVLRQQQALAEARTVWAKAAQTFDQLLQKAATAHADMQAKANSICEMKLAALQLQTANKGYGVDAKAFEDHILLLTSADDALQALKATYTTASAATRSRSGIISADGGTASAFSAASVSRSQSSTAAYASGSGATVRRPPTPLAMAHRVAAVEESDDEGETGLEAYGGVGPSDSGTSYSGSLRTGTGTRYGYVSSSAGNGNAGSGFSSSTAAGPSSVLTVASGMRTTTTTTQRAFDRQGHVIFEVVRVQVAERLTAVQVATWLNQWGPVFNNGMALANIIPAFHPKEPSIILHIGLLLEEVTCGQIRVLLAHLGHPRVQWIKRGWSDRNGRREDCAWVKFVTLAEAIDCKYRWDAMSDFGLTPFDAQMGRPKDLHFSFSTKPGYRGQRN